MAWPFDMAGAGPRTIRVGSTATVSVDTFLTVVWPYEFIVLLPLAWVWVVQMTRRAADSNSAD